MVVLQVTVHPLAPLHGEETREKWQTTGEHTVNGADGEAEPPVLMTVQNKQNDEVRNGWQDDSRSAQTGPSHEELTSNDRVTQATNVAEGESHSDATHCVFEAADLDQAGASHHEDQGQSDVDDDVVAEQWGGDDERETDAAFAVDLREGGDWVDECEDCENAEAEEDDHDAEAVDCIAESG